MNPALYPRLVAVETTSFCSARCVFCPNDSLKRGKRHMADELFESIIEQCREFALPAIEPFIQGDPFSDPKILSRLEMIHRRLPRTKLRLYTNGYNLTPERADAIADCNIDHLFVSLNTTDPERYKAVMGLKLERTLANLRYLTAPSRARKVARQITVRMVRVHDTSLEEQEKFLALCKELEVKPFISGLFNYKGDIQSDLPVPNYPCEHMDRLDILSDGKVTLCCMDQDGEFAWGDVTTTPILEVYRGAVASKYREMHWSGRRKEIHPCDTCNLFWPGLEGLPLLKRAKFGVQAGLYFLRHRPTGKQAPKPVAKAAPEPALVPPPTNRQRA
jgi:molybdenum cofactor biosynthesis enzyme MoaA